MKKTLLALPFLLVAGCSSNTTPVADSPSGSSTRTAPDISGVATPYVAKSSGAGNNAVASSAPQVPTPAVPSSNAPSSNAPSSNVPPPNVSSGAKMPQVPPGMAMGSAMALPATPQLDAQIAAAQKGSDKKKLAVLLANRGTQRMNDPNAAARVKYRAALQDYRAALKADATNLEAKTNAKLIESIYTQMGRPIPQ